jgi:hypothetical protein
VSTVALRPVAELATSWCVAELAAPTRLASLREGSSARGSAWVPRAACEPIAPRNPPVAAAASDAACDSGIGAASAIAGPKAAMVDATTLLFSHKFIDFGIRL